MRETKRQTYAIDIAIGIVEEVLAEKERERVNVREREKGDV